MRIMGARGATERALRHLTEPMRELLMRIRIPRLVILALTLALFFQLRGAVDLSARASDVPSGSAYTAEWRITGPTGGDARGLVVDPNDANRLYFGTLDGQIYTSHDGARTWRLLANFNRPQLFVDHIIVDPRNSKVLYVATHRHKEPGGFFKSVDGGLTWREAPELRDQALHSITQSEANPDILLVGTISGVYRSNDSGDTWSALPTIPKSGNEVDVESL